MGKIKPLLVFKYALITSIACIVLYMLAVSGFVIATLNNSSMIIRLLSILMFLLTALFYTHESKTLSGYRYDDEEELEVIIVYKLLFLVINAMPFIFLAVIPLLNISLSTWLYVVGIMIILTFWRRITNIFLLLMRSYSAYYGKVLSLRKERKWHWAPRGASYYTIYYIALFELENGKTVPLCIDRVSFYLLKEQQKATLVWLKYPRNKIYGAIIF